MRKPLAFGLAVLCLCLATPRLASAVDFPALPDGGSLIKTTDGGPLITVDTGHVTDWVPAIRCSTLEGSSGVHYRFSSDGGSATQANQVIEVNRTMDIPVAQGNVAKLRYLSLLSEDGGIPACRLQQPYLP